MRPVFGDAFYFVAWLNRFDQHHSKAVEFARRYTGEIVTTRFVLVETADALASSLRVKARSFIDIIETDSANIIVRKEPDLFRKGLALYGERLDKHWTLTDCISFIVMDELDLTDALTGDHHFEQAGFNALLK
jgi:uncharacterized protein